MAGNCTVTFDIDEVLLGVLRPLVVGHHVRAGRLLAPRLCVKVEVAPAGGVRLTYAGGRVEVVSIFEEVKVYD